MFGERFRWLAIAFAISALLNLFFAGIVVGRLTVPAFIRFASPKAGLVSREELRDLPVSERRAFGVAYRRHFAEIRADHERARAAKLAAEDAIGAAQFDRKTVEAKLAALRQAHLVQETALQAAVVDGLAALSPQARAAIAKKARTDAENAP